MGRDKTRRFWKAARKMQLSEFRPHIAANCTRSDPALAEMQKWLYRSTVLRDDGLIGHRGRGAGPPATYRTISMLILCAMVGERGTVADRVERLWCAEHQFTGPCPITKASILAEALVAVLQNRSIRAKLRWLDLDLRHDAAILVWMKGRPSVFHPHDPAEWARRVANARAATGVILIKRLPGGAFDKLAQKFEEMLRHEATGQEGRA